MSSGITSVSAVFKTNSGHEYGGAISAESGCWSMLKGGLTVDSSGPVELYFEVFMFLSPVVSRHNHFIVIASRRLSFKTFAFRRGVLYKL